MIIRECALYFEKMKTLYRQFFSLEGALDKMLHKTGKSLKITPVRWIFYIRHGHWNLPKEITTKHALMENWDIRPIYLFSSGCVLSMSRKWKHYTVDFFFAARERFRKCRQNDIIIYGVMRLNGGWPRSSSHCQLIGKRICAYFNYIPRTKNTLLRIRPLWT